MLLRKLLPINLQITFLKITPKNLLAIPFGLDSCRFFSLSFRQVNNKQIPQTLDFINKILDLRDPCMNGDNGIRTRGLYVANVALSQLSYVPMLTTARFSLHKIPCRFSRQRKWRQQGSNLRPHACDACALPAELCLRQLFYHIFQKLQLFFCFIFNLFSILFKVLFVLHFYGIFHPGHADI